MTLRTTSATRRSVVSRSKDVASTSATSSSSDSAGDGSGLETTELMLVMIAVSFSRPVDTWAMLLGKHRAKVRSGGDTGVLLTLAAPHKYPGDCGIFRRNRVRSRPQIRPES